MSKVFLNTVVMHQVLPGDIALAEKIPFLAHAQAKAHEVDFPEDIIRRARNNFDDILQRNGVDIWMISEPYGAGAIFTSPLKIGDRLGLQGEDAVVDPLYRGYGFGTALVCFRARLAKEMGYDFVAWECEDGNDDLVVHRHDVYKHLGGRKRPGMKPFRLGKAVIDALADQQPYQITQQPVTGTYRNMPVTEYRCEGFSATVSQRFSIFRTLARGSVEGDYNQTSTGIQIENLKFDDFETAKKAVTTILQVEAQKPTGCVFADIAVDAGKPEQMSLVAAFDAEQNTYSGNPSFLWILEGEAFEKAAQRGNALKII